MENRLQFADLLDPIFREIVRDAEKQLPEKRGMIFNEFTSTKQDEKDSGVSELSQFVERSEGGAVTYEDQEQGYDVTYTHKEWALGASVTKLMWDDDQHNQIRRKPADLAKARIRTTEQIGADIFNNGFTAGGGGKASFTGGDAVALFSASHTRTDGGSNLSNYTTADLAEDALETAMVAMSETLDNKGQLVLIQPDTLLVPPALEKEARILLDSQQRVGTANNDVNPYKGALNLVVWHYLGSAGGGSNTAWFLLDSSAHHLNWFWRERPVLTGPEKDFDTDTAKWKMTFRASAGFSDWRGTYGSKGDNS